MKLDLAQFDPARVQQAQIAIALNERWQLSIKHQIRCLASDARHWRRKAWHEAWHPKGSDLILRNYALGLSRGFITAARRLKGML